MSIVQELNLTGQVPNYHNITKVDMLNGDGLRTVLWLAGCSHKCKECHNPITWNEEDGLPVTDEVLMELFEALEKPWCTGITFSGGDPLFIKNREFTGLLAKYIKEKYPNKDIWLYTGYTLRKQPEGCFFCTKFEEFDWDYLKYIDIIVDGPFDCEIRKRDLENGEPSKWKGSSNQRVIDIKETLQKDYLVLRE